MVIEASGQPAPNPAIRKIDQYGDPLPPGAIGRFGCSRLRHGELEYSLAYSPDGKMLASFGCDFTVRVWDTGSGKEIRRFPLDKPPIGPCPHHGLGFSADGKTLAAVADNTTTYLWDLATGKELPRPKVAVERNPSGVILSADFETIVGASYGGDVYVRETRTGRETHRFRAPEGVRPASVTGPGRVQPYVRPLALSPDGKMLIGSDTTAGVWLWDPASGKKIRQLQGAKDGWFHAACSCDGKMAAVCNGPGLGGGGLGIWDTATGREIHLLQEDSDGCSALAFSPDGKILAVGYREVVRLWDTKTGKSIRSLAPFPSVTFALAFSPDGKTLAAGSGNGTIHLWDTATGKERIPQRGHQSPISFAGFASQDKTLISADEDNNLRIWDVASGKDLHQLRDETVRSVAVSPDGVMIVTGGESTMKFWDASTLKKLRQVGMDKGHRFPRIAFTSNGGTLATLTLAKKESKTGFFHSYCLWQVDSGKKLLQKDIDRSFWEWLELSREGKFVVMKKTLAAYSPPTYFVWHPRSDRKLTLGGSPSLDIEGPSCTAFSADGKTFATGDCVGRYYVADGDKAVLRKTGGAVQLWDPATGKKLRTLGSPDGCSALAFSADGKFLAGAVEEDRTIRIWNVADGKERYRFESGPGKVGSLAFSASGKMLVSAQPDHTLLLWDTGDLKKANDS